MTGGDNEEALPTEIERPPDKATLYWFALATTLGYNELAKLATTLGDKAYFRLLRDHTNKEFLKSGGNSNLFAVEDEVISINVPYSNMPNIIFGHAMSS